jgi:hypothetical protein
MRRATFSKWATVAGVLLAVSASSARAEECQDSITAINKRMDEIVATRKDGDPRTLICARLGRMSGLSQAIQIIANECLEEGTERDSIIKSAKDGESMLDVDLVCK